MSVTNEERELVDWLQPDGPGGPPPPMLRRFQDYIDDAYTPLERADRVADMARTIVDITSRYAEERFGPKGSRSRR
jgi:hypothetical protein